MPRIESEEALPNARPERVETFLVEGGIFDGWVQANRRQARFFLLNLEKVLNDLNPNHTRTESYFREAEELIRNETDWVRQVRFDYLSSHTQIRPEKRSKAKLFGHAVTIIVAMELIAEEIDPEYNVYDYLRIIPATFFLDTFSRAALVALEEHFNGMSKEERAATFGDEAAVLGFEQVMLNGIDQPKSHRLLAQMASGYTSTHWVCEKLRRFVADKFPAELHLDATRQSGADDTNEQPADAIKLASKGAAESLRVPRARLKELLPPCR